MKLFLQGVLIHAFVRHTLIYKFQSEIKEDKVYTIQSFSVSCNGGSYRTTNHAYKINFQFGNKVNMLVSIFLFFFFFFAFNFWLMFFFLLFPFSVDVTRIFTGVGTERELEKRWEQDQNECHPY